MGCHIYVIGGESGAIKIGMAADAERRLHDLQAASPLVLRIYYLGLVADRDAAQRAEMRTHGMLRLYRLHGEWFSASVLMAIEAIIVACFELDIALKHIRDPRLRHVPRLGEVDVRRADRWARSRQRRGRR